MRIALTICLVILPPSPGWAWGRRGHRVIDRAALNALPADGPVFLENYADWITANASIPDTWRSPSEPFLKIDEDPNHGWFREQFAFMADKDVPRSRYEFVLAIYNQYLKIRTTNPELAERMNVRWTGTLPYAAVESYERLITGMRLLRAARAQKQDTKFLEMDCAFYVARLGHYVGDGGQPLHDTIQHDGWVGPDPQGYTRDPRIHGRFESGFVDKIQLKPEDIAHRIGKFQDRGDVFEALLAYLDAAGSHVEEVYQLDKRHAFDNAADPQARELVYMQTAAAAQMLRDLICMAWQESGTTPSPLLDPVDSTNPNYNPSTGSAPAPLLQKAIQ
ncbi:MAG: phospholipase C/P1 nuclease family protein [Acidobacteriaceae bacterium]